ncbi:hypothetical protein RCL1_004553 [Eukaryota sp. TZLM3-RCL]
MDPGYLPDVVHQPNEDLSPTYINSYVDFLNNFQVNNAFIYRQKLEYILEKMPSQLTNNNPPLFEIFVEDIHLFNPELTSLLKTDAEATVSYISKACLSVLSQIRHFELPQDLEIPIAIVSKSTSNLSVRTLNEEHIDSFIILSGIVSHASRPRVVSKKLVLKCRSCQHIRDLHVSSGLAKFSLPPFCSGSAAGSNNNCGKDPYEIQWGISSFRDQKIIRVQEFPEDTPTGDVARSLTVTLDGVLADSVSPGQRVCLSGILSTYSSGTSSLRTPYIRGLGVVPLNESGSVAQFNDENRSKFVEFAKRGFRVVYEEIINSVAPEIYGLFDLKAAIACSLFGGCAKMTTDGMRIRGDINVLFMGDPGTAKSQLLRRAAQLAPRSVITAGRGASAAGLTAAVSRDPATNGFYLEGGALVLADGGVCCIDEFDKVSVSDRVAIHEAMEQQTISISKAGITTMLSSRAAVLAAANPSFGRWDDLKAFDENIDLQQTILSRFDLIFLIRDNLREETDRKLARHVMSVHRGFSFGFNSDTTESDAPLEPPVSPSFLKQYIAFARNVAASPILSHEAIEKLSLEYVSFRETTRTSSFATIPITVRQLEAVIRTAEALARMELSSTVNLTHCEEALRLFRESTLTAAQQGVGIEGMTSTDTTSKVKEAIELIKSRIPVSALVKVSALISDFERFEYNRRIVHTALEKLVRRGDFEFRNMRKYVERVRN